MPDNAGGASWISNEFGQTIGWKKYLPTQAVKCVILLGPPMAPRHHGLSVFPSVGSVCPSILRCVRPSVRPLVDPSVCPSINASVSLLIGPSVSRSVLRSFLPPVHMIQKLSSDKSLSTLMKAIQCCCCLSNRCSWKLYCWCQQCFSFCYLFDWCLFISIILL